jgi:hypothetical protein
MRGATRVCVAGALLAVVLATGGVASAKAPAWLPVRSLAINYQFGELPKAAHQTVVGRVRIDQVARVKSAVINGKRREGDLLLVRGRYENLQGQPTYWTEGYAFVFGTRPTRCKLETCGPLPKGTWLKMTHAFGVPYVDYPLASKVRAHGAIAFREAIPMPPVTSANPAIASPREVWLLPIYAAFNYYEQPFPVSQLIRLSDYLGRDAF